MDYRPIKRAVFSFLTAADKGRLKAARARSSFVLRSPAMAETESDSDETQVPDLVEWPEGWLPSPKAKRKVEANHELIMDPAQFKAKKYRKVWTETELLTKKRSLQSLNEESMWVENNKFRNVVALLEDIKHHRSMKKGRV